MTRAEIRGRKRGPAPAARRDPQWCVLADVVPLRGTQMVAARYVQAPHETGAIQAAESLYDDAVDAGEYDEYQITEAIRQ